MATAAAPDRTPDTPTAGIAPPSPLKTALTHYRTLGRSGLAVSPIALGTMTFGTDWGWGADDATSRALFDRYLDAGGNFVDTADGYTGGRSEEMLGRYVRDRGARDRVVLATKYTFSAEPGNPNAGGNGRKNARRALEGSLRRLGTDYVDLYWIHAWDTRTPVEEAVRTMDDFVSEGKVRYVGLSDVPAWYFARWQTLAEWHGRAPVAALQLEYSLAERGVEREHVPAARALGAGVVPWSPLAGGFLSGKYRRNPDGSFDGGGARLDATKGSGNPVFEKFTRDANWRLLDVLRAVAEEAGRPMAQVALHWAATQPGVASVLVGATRPEQLDANLAALDFALDPALRARLDAASAPEPGHPYEFFGETMQGMMTGGVRVDDWAAQQARR
jgi:aryl-alcohol dehydrogenase-like predicted oxidoreductase